MKISSRVDYALSCVLRIADKYESRKPVTAVEISRQEKIKPDYIEQLLLLLKKRKILKSFRGRSGGYVLSACPEDISVFSVVKAIENEILKPVCFREKGRRKKCVHFDDCKIISLWIGLKENMEKYLKRKNIEELLLLRRKEKNWRENRRIR
ncbi:MAG: Rrf2 family transcriptional regulator [bacterium]|nr:Rrf2 family transcriptional regulator [bacterium]